MNMNEFCSGCGTKFNNETINFCPSCGNARNNSQNNNNVLNHNVNANVNLLGNNNEICPQCQSLGYSRTYGLWNFVIAFIFFPIGLLAFLAPIKICQNGHKYGIGQGLAEFMSGLGCLILGIIILLFIIAACSSMHS
jgi:hypothetical protein